MADYDDDDLVDYSDGEEFNEDNLDDGEYEKLYAQLPVLKQQLADYNDSIAEIDLKEALYFNYYSVEDSMNELKDKYPRKKIITTVPTTVTPSVSAAEAPSPSAPSKPLSKLALLAQKRKEASSSGSVGNATNSAAGSALSLVSKLLFIGGKSKLLMLASANSSKLKLSTGTSTTSASTNSISILDKLKSKSSSTEPSVGKLSLSLNTTSIRKRKRPTIAIEEQQEVTTSDTRLPSTEAVSTTKAALITMPTSQLSNVVFDDSNLLKLGKTSLSTFLFQQEDHSVDVNKKRRLNHFKDIFEPITNFEVNKVTVKKIQTNFSEPSPDQKITDAQRAAFEENLSGLSLKDKSSLVSSSSTGNSGTSTPKNSGISTPKTFKSTKSFKNIDVVKSVKSAEKYQKPSKSFVVIGHVDAGKSTLLGRILYDVGAVDGKTLNKLTREAEKAGKGSFALAWIMDQTSEERARGVTVDICATHFETPNSRFTAIDAPGHKDFVPQAISGVTQADYAVLVIDSINGEFEAGFNMDGQTKEHTLLARYLGVEKLIVVVNKMDKENWSKDRFEEIKFQMSTFLTSEENDVGFKREQIEFIPLCGLSGNNLVKRDTSILEFSWYKGPSLIEYLDLLPQVEKPIDELINGDFNLTINDVFEQSGSEFNVTGKILSGVIQAGESVKIVPLNEQAQVQSISVNEKPVDFAMSGEVAQLKFKTSQLSGTSVAVGKVSSTIVAGDMLVKVDETTITASDKFECEIKLFLMNKPLLVGTPFILFKNNCHALGRITKIIDIVSDKKKKKMHLVSKQVARVEIQCERSLPVTTYEQNHIVGRVVLRREGHTIGAGKITKSSVSI